MNKSAHFTPEKKKLSRVRSTSLSATSCAAAISIDNLSSTRLAVELGKLLAQFLMTFVALEEILMMSLIVSSLAC